MIVENDVRICEKLRISANIYLRICIRGPLADIFNLSRLLNGEMMSFMSDSRLICVSNVSVIGTRKLDNNAVYACV